MKNHFLSFTLLATLLVAFMPTLFADPALREEIQIYPGPGWQYADTGNRNTFAPPSGGWSSTELQWPNLYWQRITLPLPAAWESRRVIAHVGAAAYGVTVYINGHNLGRYQNPVTPTEVDITPYIDWSGTNTLMLGLEDWTTFLGSSFPLSNNGIHFNHAAANTVQGPMGYAQWLFQRRLWTRNVSILAVPAVRVDDVFVKPSVRESKLDVELTLRNDDAVARTVTIHNHVTNWQEATVEKTFPGSSLNLPAGSSIITTVTVPWSDAELWSPDSPHLYNLVTTVTQGANQIDTLSTRFGFREFWIEKSADDTRSWYVLNGNRQNFRGEGLWNPGMGVSYVNTFMDWLKENNFNMLRISNGGLPEYYSMADEKGIFIQSEMPFMFNHKYDYSSPLFWQRAQNIMLAQIRAYRNHPSIVFWGVENEVMLTSPGANIGDNLLAIGNAALALDPTRGVMHEGDGDLRTNITGAPSAGKNVQTVNTHDYEVEAKRTGGVTSIMDFPNAAYAYGNATSISNFPSYPYGTVLPDKSKPWFIGEFGPGTVFNHPHGMSFLCGDDAYVDLFGLSAGLLESTGLYYGFQIDGYRYFDHISGIAPWATYYGDPRIASAPVIRKFFKPVTVRIREWTHNFFAGDTVARTLTVHNDDVTGTSNFDLQWRLVQGSDILLNGSQTFAAEPGFLSRRTLSFVAPQTSTRMETILVLDLHRNGQLVDTQIQDLSIFPPRNPLSVPAGLPVYVRDPSQSTANALIAAGVSFTTIPNLNMASRPKGLLIIGFAGYSPSTPTSEIDSIRNWVRDGGTVLVTSDQWYHAPWLSFYNHPSYKVDNFWVRATIGFIRAPHHPIMRNLREDDFKWWAPDHLVVGDDGNFTKPSAGLATVLVDAGGRLRGLGDSPLAEYPDGKGSTLVNRLLLFQKIDQEPVTRVVLQNILDYATRVVQQPAPKAIAVLSGNHSETTAVLNRMGIAYVELDGQLAGHSGTSLSNAYSVVIVNNVNAAWTELIANQAKIQAFVRDGGTLILRRLTTDRALQASTLTGVDLSIKPTQLTHPQLEKNHADPFLDGISNDDAFWVVASDYRTQVWHPRIVEHVVAVDENASVKGLLAEPARTGVLFSDSGESYNPGSATRDTGTAIDNPGFGLVRIQPMEAKGSFLIDQLVWQETMGVSYQRKAQRLLSALLVNAHQTHTSALPLQEIDLPGLAALMHLLLPDGSTESVSLTGSGTIALFAGTNGETVLTNALGHDQAKAGFVALDLNGESSAGSVRVRLNPRQPSMGTVTEKANPTPGALDIPPFFGTGSADSGYDLHLEIVYGGQTMQTNHPLRIHANLEDSFFEIGEAFLNTTGSVPLVNSADGSTEHDLLWDVFMPRPPQGTPSFTISSSQNQPLRLAWPAPGTWVLQSSQDLRNWPTVPGPYPVLGNDHHFTIHIEDLNDSSHFFRLSRPGL